MVTATPWLTNKRQSLSFSLCSSTCQSLCYNTKANSWRNHSPFFQNKKWLTLTILPLRPLCSLHNVGGSVSLSSTTTFSFGQPTDWRLFVTKPIFNHEVEYMSHSSKDNQRSLSLEKWPHKATKALHRLWQSRHNIRHVNMYIVHFQPAVQHISNK
jgi:hypothetical protein